MPNVKSPSPANARNFGEAGKRLLSASYLLIALAMLLISTFAWATFAVVRALEMTGKSNPARMAMIEITTSSSISVKPRRRRRAWNNEFFIVNASVSCWEESMVE